MERPTEPDIPNLKRLKAEQHRVADLVLFVRFLRNQTQKTFQKAMNVHWPREDGEPMATVPRDVEELVADYLGIDLGVVAMELKAVRDYHDAMVRYWTEPARDRDRL